MVSWFKKSKGNNGSKSEYEPLYPLPPPRRGQTQMLKYAVLSGCLCLGAAAVLIVLILEGTGSTTDTSNEKVNNGDQQLLLLSATQVTSALPISEKKPKEDENVQDKATAPADSKNDELVKASSRRKTSTVEEDILVEVEQGVLRGTKMKSRAGRDYLAFLGVPYAKPPLGELRFKPPVEVDAWEGTRNATKSAEECIQKDKYNADPTVVLGLEDCLYLNIYTPKALTELSGRRNRFPVMLYVHGGGVYGNATRYGADYFMDEDVILIMMGYRLGAFGNLNTNDSVTGGNQGLRDQVKALEWIKANIKQFGGDRRKVTLFGNSYGSMEVHAHLLSPLSKGLFHRAICQSGNLFVQDMFNENPVQTAFDFGVNFNCSLTNSTELVDCLRKVPAADIARKSLNYDFSVSIESPTEDDDTIVPGHPLALLENGDSNDVPVIFGITSGEALATSLDFLNNVTQSTEYLNENFNSVMIEKLKLNETASDPTAIIEAAHQFYLGEKNVSRETATNLTNLISDRNTIHPTFTAANFQSENNSRRKNVYMYYFDWEVAQKYSRKAEAVYKPDEFLGASHADELQLLFPYDDFPYVSLDSVHANLSLTMVKLWVSFAADGVPSGTTNEWEPIKANEKPFKLFELNSNSLKMIDPLGERMAFWDQFNLTDLYVSINSPNY